MNFRKSIMNRIMILTILALSIMSCRPRHNDVDDPADVLAQMRSDTEWIHQLDSMAQTAIGPGARCIDPVQHIFSYDGRVWLFNQDWGGVLEIPGNYIVEDDMCQAELSFHGTRAFSPDSLIAITCYAGFQGTEPLSIVINSTHRGAANCFVRKAGPDSDGIVYMACVQYTDEKSEEAQSIIKMISRYPIGPTGSRE